MNTPEKDFLTFKEITELPLFQKSIFLLAFVGLGVYALFDNSIPISNWDTFFHVRFGEEFVSGHWTLTKHNMPGYASSDWIPTQYLSQCLMGYLYTHWGWTSIHILFFLSILTLIMGSFIFFSKRSGFLAGVILSLIYYHACFFWLTTRPIVFSFSLALGAVAIFYQTKKNIHWVWLFIPLFWLWPQIHGAWPTLLPLPLILLIASIGTKEFAKAKIYGVASLLTIAATFVTPVGPKLWGAVISINGKGAEYSEFARPAFTSFVFLSSIIITLLAGVFFWKVKRDLLTLGVFTFSLLLMYYNGRTFTFGLLLMASIFETQETIIFGKIKYAFGVIGLALLSVFALNAPTLGVIQPFEKEIVTRLEAEPAGTRVYAYDFIGSYMLFAYPNLEPVAHGYADLYTEEELANLDHLIYLDDQVENTLKETGATLAILPTGSQDVNALKKLGWETIFMGPSSTMLTPPSDW